jgi:hypothetical protein
LATNNFPHRYRKICTSDDCPKAAHSRPVHSDTYIVYRRPPAAQRRRPRRGVRSQARRHPLTSPWWALETPQPCQAWHGRGLRGLTSRSAGSAALGKAMYIGLLKHMFFRD